MAFIDRRMFLAACGLVCLVVPAQAAAEQTPHDIVVEIYKVSAGKSGKYDGPSAISDKSVRTRFLSKSLQAALSAMDKKSAKTNEPILDFDPITNSQDPAVKDLVIAAEEQTDTSSIVAVRFWSYEKKDASLVRYHFIREGNLWKLDEITGNVRGEDKSEPWSLRAIIK
jgi:opacity protein-like surface antigen